MGHIVYSWEDIERYTKELARKIAMEELGETIWLMPIMNGGFIPSVLMSKELNKQGIKHLQGNIHMKSYDGRTKKDVIVEGYRIPFSVREPDTVILVDDVYDTGDTMKTAISMMKILVRPNTNIYSVVITGKSDVSLDNYCYATTSDKWVVFPWE